MSSQLIIETNPPITILFKNAAVEIADSQTFFTDDVIVTVPECIQVSTMHGHVDDNETFVAHSEQSTLPCTCDANADSVESCERHREVSR